MQTLRRAKVLVIGDVMLDRYWSGATQRISPEAPVPVVRIEQDYERLGGAGNVAANISAVGATAYLLATLGDDEAARQIEKLARQADIDCCLVKDPNDKTTVKLRVISQQQQLLRLDFEKGNATQKQADQLKLESERLLGEVDVVVISDYGKGGVPDPAELIELADASNVPVIVDPKGRNFDKYRGATLVTPNFREFEDVVGRCADEQEIERKAKILLEQTQIQSLLVTRGDQGMSLICGEQSMHTLAADSKEVFDVTGAGDTVCGVLAAGIAAGLDLHAAVELANRAAGIVVGKFGTATVSGLELSTAGSPESQQSKLFTSSALSETVKARQANGNRIVMTNGCFDVLHAGHVEYLSRARSLGDFLLVAVNSDSSVSRLKGDSRPINALGDRLSVLAGLASVDALVTFDELTPINLIESLLPDVLVKGGDYEADDIVGADAVRAAGGQVHVLPFVEGLSSSAIIEKMGNSK